MAQHTSRWTSVGGHYQRSRRNPLTCDERSPCWAMLASQSHLTFAIDLT